MIILILYNIILGTSVYSAIKSNKEIDYFTPALLMISIMLMLYIITLSAKINYYYIKQKYEYLKLSSDINEVLAFPSDYLSNSFIQSSKSMIYYGIRRIKENYLSYLSSNNQLNMLENILKKKSYGNKFRYIIS